jgi:hypothetical protein
MEGPSLRLMEGPSLAGLLRAYTHRQAFNNILSLMRQDYACLQSATVIHFAARGIKRYSLGMKK